MSNEYQDWMRDGGCCGDCIYNVFLGSIATCAQDMSSHRKERCDHYKEVCPECGQAGFHKMSCGSKGAE